MSVRDSLNGFCCGLSEGDARPGSLDKDEDKLLLDFVLLLKGFVVPVDAALHAPDNKAHDSRRDAHGGDERSHGTPDTNSHWLPSLHRLVVVVEKGGRGPVIQLGEGAEDFVLRAVVGEVISNSKRMICFEIVPVRSAARLGFRLRLRLRLGNFFAVLIELVLRGNKVRIMGLVESDARLLDGGIEFPVDGVTTNGAIGDVLSPSKFKVRAWLLGLFAEQAEQGSASFAARGPPGLRLVLLLADVELLIGTDDGLVLEDHAHVRLPDTDAVCGRHGGQIVVCEAAGFNRTGSDQVGPGDGNIAFREPGAPDGDKGVVSSKDSLPDFTGIAALFLLCVCPRFIKCFHGSSLPD
nr:MAG TPA: hypothetical protein [Caudoviricetes sp.]